MSEVLEVCKFFLTTIISKDIVPSSNASNWDAPIRNTLDPTRIKAADQRV